MGGLTSHEEQDERMRAQCDACWLLLDCLDEDSFPTQRFIFVRDSIWVLDAGSKGGAL
jgi:hypothetical protein